MSGVTECVDLSSCIEVDGTSHLLVVNETIESDYLTQIEDSTCKCLTTIIINTIKLSRLHPVRFIENTHQPPL